MTLSRNERVAFLELAEKTWKANLGPMLTECAGKRVGISVRTGLFCPLEPRDTFEAFANSLDKNDDYILMRTVPTLT